MMRPFKPHSKTGSLCPTHPETFLLCFMLVHHGRPIVCTNRVILDSRISCRLVKAPGRRRIARRRSRVSGNRRRNHHRIERIRTRGGCGRSRALAEWFTSDSKRFVDLDDSATNINGPIASIGCFLGVPLVVLFSCWKSNYNFHVSDIQTLTKFKHYRN